jgi:hypothetical protein
MLNARISDPTAAAACVVQLPRERRGAELRRPGTRRCPATKQAPNSDPGHEVHVVSVSISVYGHPAWDSLGAGDYQAHVQVS